MKQWIFFALATLTAGAVAQIRVVKTESLSLPASFAWNAPRFSPDGERVFVTTGDFTGIWEYSRSNRGLHQLTGDRGAGFGYALAPDNDRLSYRKTTPAAPGRMRKDELVTLYLQSGRRVVHDSGPRLSLPTFVGGELAYAVGKNELRVAGVRGREGVALIGIEDTKIALVRAGQKVILDPLGNGSYIWPALSPDGTRLVAYDMARGTFVCDLNGVVTARLGRCDAPSWTRDGKWIVFVKENNDGHVITGSDLYMVSVDGERRVRLTDTPEEIEQNPRCSPSKDEIVYNTLTGGIRILSYQEVGQ
jgi:dipeptidyl aminopeptidase/acylaminoacyl peptidase